MRRHGWIWIRLIVMLALMGCSSGAPATVATAPVESTQEIPEEPPVETPEVEAQDGPDSTITEGQGERLDFKIITEGTQARFIIDEVLRGEPTTVVGVTDRVSGEIRVNLAVPDATEIGVITIEAGGLQTDNSFRNGAIERLILQTGAYPLITFTPVSIEGLPEDVSAGEVFSFIVTGDLTIREITRTESFSVTVSAVSESEIKGQAEAVILRGDYDLTIPSVPQVADVSEDVRLELEFTATR